MGGQSIDWGIGVVIVDHWAAWKLHEQITHALKQYEVHAASQHLLIPPFQVGDTIWLDSRNIKTTCLSKNLDHCFLGLFTIVERVSSHGFQLSLSLALSRIHPVFHVSLLQCTSSSESSNRAIDPPPLIELDNSDKWEVNWILYSMFYRHCKGSWKGFDNTPDAMSGEPPENLENAPNIVQAFHQAYPDKLAP